MSNTAFDLALSNFDSSSRLHRTTAGTPLLISPVPARSQKASWRWLAWALAAAATVVAVVALTQPWKWFPTHAAASEYRESLPVVSVAQPSPAATATVVLPATIRPWQTATLNARVSGYLKVWHVDLGARVQAGDVLAEIETPELDQELAEGVAQANEAEAATLQAKAERIEAEAELQATESQLTRIRAESDLANVDRLKELQHFQRIIAPLDVVTSREAEVGMLVTAGKEALFTVEDMSRVRVQVRVPQAYSTQTSVGVAATVSVPESAAQAVSGTITRTADSVDSTNRTMLAEIELENSAGLLQPGSYAQVSLTTQQNLVAWTIPTNTLQMRVEGPHVAIVDERNQVAIQPVKLGRDLGNRIVVLEGIRGTERLVVNPTDTLARGMHVQVKSPETHREIAKR